MSFMKKQIIKGNFFRIETTNGVEYINADDVGRTCSTHVESLLNYLAGTPFDADELCELHDGYLARLSAPGYLDCTEWAGFTNIEGANAYLDDLLGEDNA